MDATAEARRRRGARVWKAAAALFALTTVTGAAVAYFAPFGHAPPSRASSSRRRRNGTSSGRPDGRARSPACSPDGAGSRLYRGGCCGQDAAVGPPGRLADRTATRRHRRRRMAVLVVRQPTDRLFHAGQTHAKIDAGGGPPQTLCALSGPTILARGGAWNREGSIVFSNGPGHSSACRQPAVSLPRPPVGDGPNGHVFPSFLPDGRHVLFYTQGTTTDVAGYLRGTRSTPANRNGSSAPTPAASTRPGVDTCSSFVRARCWPSRSIRKRRRLWTSRFPIAERVEFEPGSRRRRVLRLGERRAGIRNRIWSGAQASKWSGWTGRAKRSRRSVPKATIEDSISLPTENVSRHIAMTRTAAATSGCRNRRPARHRGSPSTRVAGALVANLVSRRQPHRLWLARRREVGPVSEGGKPGAGTEEQLVESDVATLP